MMTIVCKSAHLASELATMVRAADSAICPTGSGCDAPDVWLSRTLAKNAVSVVFYEPSFFVDPAPFRTISPGTSFVVLAGPGDEQDARRAMVCGACAVIGKPLVPQDVDGVMSLVSR
jgi:hypothetical protein